MGVYLRPYFFFGPFPKKKIIEAVYLRQVCQLGRRVIWHSRRQIGRSRFGVDVVAVSTTSIGRRNVSGAANGRSDICSGVGTRWRWRAPWQRQRQLVETGYCGVTSASHASSASDGIQANENVRVATVRGSGVSCAGTERQVLCRMCLY